MGHYLKVYYQLQILEYLKWIYLPLYSTQIIKIHNEIGSPYLIPLPILKGSPRISFTSQEKLVVIIHFINQFVHFSEKQKYCYGYLYSRWKPLEGERLS